MTRYITQNEVVRGFDIGVDRVNETEWIISSVDIHVDGNVEVEVMNDIYMGDVIGVSVKAGYEGGIASLEMKVRGDRVHLWHIYVSEPIGGMGFGTILTDIFKKFVSRTEASRVSGRVGNGGTKGFLSSRGFPEDEMEVVTVEEGKVQPMEVVAIGAGESELDVEVSEALLSFDGFRSDKIEGVV